MSNPFNFDPFAAPAPAPPSSSGNNPPPAAAAGGRGATPSTATAPTTAAINPFDAFGDAFGFGQPSNNNANNNAQRTNANGNNGNVADWQQTARAAMMSGNGVWKNALGVSQSNNLASSSSQKQHSGSSNSLQPKQVKRTKRIVPYTSPISTLESNWDPYLFVAAQLAAQQSSSSSSPSPLPATTDAVSLWKNGGNTMTYLVVRANTACCLSGGVESLLKWNKSRGSGSRRGSGFDGELGTTCDSSLSLGEEDSFHSTSGNTPEIGNNMNRSLGKVPSINKPSVGNSMRFLKSGLKKAQASIERSVTTMAIKADFGGKNPDCICVSLHYCSKMNVGISNKSMASGLGVHPNSVELGDVCLSRTEWVELPSNSGSGDNGSEEEGVLFSIPLCVADLAFLEAASASSSSAGSAAAGPNGGGVQLTVRLYLRSGATLLKAVANREYCIGESALLYSNLMQLMNTGGGGQQQQPTNGANGGLKCGTINVPFTTGMIAETPSFSGSFNSSTGGDAPAALHITATPRIKFNPPCTYGWSLSDPISTTPPVGPLNWLKMFNMPLDQAYVFNLVGQHQLLNSNNQQQMTASSSSNALLLANERATESALTLPLATTCSHLFSHAAMRSQSLASLAANKTRRKETIHLSPQEDEYRSKAVVEAALVDGSAFVELGVVALVMLGEREAAECGLYGNNSNGENVPSVKASMAFQPPNTIFEESLGVGSCPLLDEASGAGYINGTANSGGSFIASGGIKEAITTKFCPRILNGLDELLPGVAGTRSNGKYIGSIRLEVAVGYANSNGPVDTISMGMNTNTSVEGLLELEDYLEDARMVSQQQQQGGGRQGDSSGGKVPVLVPAMDANTGRRIGTFVLLLRVTSYVNRTATSSQATATANSSDTSAASSGLVSVVGLTTLTEELGLAPYLDVSNVPLPNSQLVASPPTPGGTRRRQVATMGSFLTTRYLIHQSQVVRDVDAKALTERYEKYYQEIQSGISADNVVEEDESDVPLFKRRTPRSFRPSNSRDDALLAGIGFNVHVQSLALTILHDNKGNTTSTPPMQQQSVGVTHSVTHGAPADHAKGFGGPSGDDNGKSSKGDATSNKKDVVAPRGGLRRLESIRMEFAKELEDSVTGLIAAVAEHFKSRAQATSMRQQQSRHIPPNLPAIIHYRKKSIECSQRLQSLTWEISVRRANCFSQALGIAVTSYMASLSDGGPAWSSSSRAKGYANDWVRHGYLITFEGLLSAVGKELGMIEDASVAIAMLRMVSVVLAPDDNANNNSTSPPSSNAKQRISVPYSPYVKWVHLIYIAPTPHGGSHSKTQYRLEIGLDPSYYQSRVPDPLKNGAAVRFFPILFQMGVDIRQWGANAGRSVTSQIKDKPKSGGGTATAADLGAFDNAIEQQAGDSGSILDDGDEDDEAGDLPDNEINLQLNVEGYRKLNSYAHSVNPTTAGVTAASALPPVFDSMEQPQATPPLPIHPSLLSLSEGIKASAGRMEHSVLDRAATACQRFGGGSTVFCKSGKDRTAMQVTFKQGQFVQRFMDKKEGGGDDGRTPASLVLEDTLILMRKHGNRIPVCEKNAGEPKFAFNPLQRKFMPEMLRPEASLCTWSKPET